MPGTSRKRPCRQLKDSLSFPWSAVGMHINKISASGNTQTGMASHEYRGSQEKYQNYPGGHKQAVKPSPSIGLRFFRRGGVYPRPLNIRFNNWTFRPMTINYTASAGLKK